MKRSISFSLSLVLFLGLGMVPHVHAECDPDYDPNCNYCVPDNGPCYDIDPMAAKCDPSSGQICCDPATDPNCSSSLDGCDHVPNGDSICTFQAEGTTISPDDVLGCDKLSGQVCCTADTPGCDKNTGCIQNASGNLSCEFSSTGFPRLTGRTVYHFEAKKNSVDLAPQGPVYSNGCFPPMKADHNGHCVLSANPCDDNPCEKDPDPCKSCYPVAPGTSGTGNNVVANPTFVCSRDLNKCPTVCAPDSCPDPCDDCVAGGLAGTPEGSTLLPDNVPHPTAAFRCVPNAARCPEEPDTPLQCTLPTN